MPTRRLAVAASFRPKADGERSGLRRQLHRRGEVDVVPVGGAIAQLRAQFGKRGEPSLVAINVTPSTASTVTSMLRPVDLNNTPIESVSPKCR